MCGSSRRSNGSGSLCPLVLEGLPKPPVLVNNIRNISNSRAFCPPHVAVVADALRTGCRSIPLVRVDLLRAFPGRNAACKNLFKERGCSPYSACSPISRVCTSRACSSSEVPYRGRGCCYIALLYVFGNQGWRNAITWPENSYKRYEAWLSRRIGITQRREIFTKAALLPSVLRSQTADLVRRLSR